MVYIRWLYQRHGLGFIRSLMVRNHCRYTVWPAGFQICHDVLLPISKNDSIWCITIVGIPFGKQFFKIAKLSLRPFGSYIVRV